MLTQKRWWSFTPEDGWQRCDGQTGQKLLRMLRVDTRGLLEGCKVAEVDERVDVAQLAKMKRPALVAALDITDDELRAIAAELVAHFGPMPVQRSAFLSERQVLLVESAPPTFIPIVPSFLSSTYCTPRSSSLAGIP